MSVCLIHSCIVVMGLVRTQCLVTTAPAMLDLKAGYVTQVGYTYSPGWEGRVCDTGGLYVQHLVMVQDM